MHHACCQHRHGTATPTPATLDPIFSQECNHLPIISAESWGGGKYGLLPPAGVVLPPARLGAEQDKQPSAVSLPAPWCQRRICGHPGRSPSPIKQVGCGSLVCGFRGHAPHPCPAWSRRRRDPAETLYRGALHAGPIYSSGAGG